MSILLAKMFNHQTVRRVWASKTTNGMEENKTVQAVDKIQGKNGGKQT
jgi:hypothetical protein